MENSTNALKMTFAVMIFATALSITFFLLTQIKETSNTLLEYADRTNYREQPMEGADSRIVGIDTVISSLKNRGLQTSYITIVESGIEGGNEYTYTLLESDDEKVENFIKTHISGSRSLYKYKETIREITTDGLYITASDTTKIPIKPGGTTRRYIIYEKQ